jgi:hypothetical protein
MKKTVIAFGVALAYAALFSGANLVSPAIADTPNVVATGNIWGLGQFVSANNLHDAEYCTVLVSAGYTGSLTYFVTDGSGAEYPNPFAPSSTVTPAASPIAVLLKIPDVTTALSVESTKYTSGGASVQITCQAAPPGPYAASTPIPLATPTATPTP